MSRPRSAHLETLFERGLALPAAERPAFLAAACGGDGELRKDLASLLAAHDASGPFFERLAQEVVAPALWAVASQPDDDLPTDDSAFPYRILERLGGGGMGEVYKALDLRLGRTVALKLLPAHLTGIAEAKARLHAEAKSASALDHPNIGVVHEVGKTRSGRLFIVMAYYEGETLQQRIARGPLPPAEAVGLTIQVARALAAVHRKSIVHRDVKPSNILVTSEGTVKLLDFGIAKVSGTDLTREGPGPGTVAYMSPEQTRGERVDPRTDLWGAGVVLYEMLTGRRPFHRSDDQAVVYAIRNDPWHTPGDSGSAIARPLAGIIGRCLEKDRERRYECAEDLRRDLKAFASGARPSVPAWVAARSWRAPLPGAAALLALLVAGMLLRSAAVSPSPETIDLTAAVDGGAPAERVIRPAAPHPDARRLYMEGRYFLDKRDEESAWKALSAFRRALDIDPNYARAWTGWADTHQQLHWLSAMPAEEAYPAMRAAARRALEIDPNLAAAHVSLAAALADFDIAIEAAAEHTRLAIELDSGSAAAHRQHAVYFRMHGRFDEALEQLRIARELDPHWRTNQQELGVTLYLAGRYDAALAALEAGLQITPDDSALHFFIAGVHLQRRQYDEALAALARATPTRRWESVEAVRASIYARTGRGAEARAYLAELERRAQSEALAWYAAVVHLSLGEVEQAIDLLEQAYEQGARQMKLLPVHPTLGVLRDHPRFVALVDRVLHGPGRVGARVSDRKLLQVEE